MADYISEATASPEIVPAKTIGDYTTPDYTLDQAIYALDVVEDCMNWAFFGVGGPA